MLSLKSYGMNSPSSKYKLPQILSENQGPFSPTKKRFSEERKKKNPLYSTGHGDFGKHVDFLDITYGVKKDSNKCNSFTDTYFAGTFTDTSLGSIERRKAKEQQSCIQRQARRDEMKHKHDESQRNLKLKKLERLTKRERRRVLNRRYHAASIKIQTMVRARLAKSKVSNLKAAKFYAAAFTIQKQYRSYRSVQDAKQILYDKKDMYRHNMANRIQTAGRHKVRRMHAKRQLVAKRAARAEEKQKLQAMYAQQQLNACILIQSKQRGQNSRKLVQKRRQEIERIKHEKQIELITMAHRRRGRSSKRKQ